MLSTFRADVLDRLVRTFVQAFVGTFALVNVADSTWSVIGAGAISAGSAGVAAVLSVLMSLFASKVGDPNSASFVVGGEESYSLLDDSDDGDAEDYEEE